MPDCTFSLLAGPADAGFLRETLQHLLRMCAFPFREKIIVADDLPNRSVPEDAAYRFSQLLQELQGDQIITQSVPLSTVVADRLSLKHFGSRVSVMRDHRSVPLFGWIAGIEQAHTDFVVHFDSDILLHQAKGHNWIEAGIPTSSPRSRPTSFSVSRRVGRGEPSHQSSPDLESGIRGGWCQPRREIGFVLEGQGC